MKTVSKRVLSFAIAVIISLTAVAPSFAAADLTWEALWATEYDNGVILFPGSNETEMNVSWYYTEETEPKVVVSNNLLFADSKTFTGDCVETYDGDFANRVTITGLEKGKTYYYQCISGDFKSNVYTFETDENVNEFSALYMTIITL